MSEFSMVPTLNILRTERKNVDKRIAALMAELSGDNMVLPDTPFRILQRVLKIHRGVKPVLSVIVKLPIIPPTWSGVIDSFVRSLDALDAPGIVNSFKAGKDI